MMSGYEFDRLPEHDPDRDFDRIEEQREHADGLAYEEWRDRMRADDDEHDDDERSDDDADDE